MNTDPLGVWGKLQLNDYNEIAAWHPLHHHCLDVAAVAEALLQHRVIHRRIESAAQCTINDPLISRLTCLAFLHDLGKTCGGFQAKRFSAAERARRGIPVSGHVDVCDALLTDRRLAALRCLAKFDIIAGWGDAASALLIASVSHHGRPWHPGSTGGGTALWQRQTWGYDPAEGLDLLGRTLVQAYPLAFERGGPTLPDAAFFQHAYAGLIQLADWIGSDTSWFPYSEALDADRLPFARAQACSALVALGLDQVAHHRQVAISRPAFGALFSDSQAKPLQPLPHQSAAADLDLGPLVLLEAETGSGKTEAALWRFKALYQAGLVDSLYFALPTRVAASSMVRRVLTMAQRLFAGLEPRPVVIQAVPGALWADGIEGRRLPGFEVQWDDDEAEHPERAQRRWAAEHPKRYLAAPLAVGTIDQALLAALKAKQAHLRFFCLGRSLLVVDEVHASDVYMTAVLRWLLRWHLAWGGHALLLSATLGAGARTALLAPAAASPDTGLPTPAAAAGTPYPLLSWQGGTQGFASGREKAVAVAMIEEIDCPDRIAQRALQAAAAGARVLVLRNTVGAAIATQRALEELAGLEHPTLFRCCGVVALHHGRYAREDRRLLDEAVELALGRSAPRNGGLVLVGTQTLEQSLDIDADLLVTDLCPGDVLLQRLGRLHRHSRERPAGFESPHAWVLTPSDATLEACLRRPRHGLGLGRDGRGVYENLLSVAATVAFLRGQRELRIPRDNRPLVEAVTHPVTLRRLAETKGGAWLEHWQQLQGIGMSRRLAGRGARLPFDERFDELEQAWDLDEDARTRLGTLDRELEVPENETAIIGPFGKRLQRIKIPFYLCPGDGGDLAWSIVAGGPVGAVRLSLGDRELIYDRLGLRTIPQ